MPVDPAFRVVIATRPEDLVGIPVGIFPWASVTPFDYHDLQAGISESVGDRRATHTGSDHGDIAFDRRCLLTVEICHFGYADYRCCSERRVVAYSCCLS